MENELLEHLKEQLYFINKSIGDFDLNEIEAKRVSVNIRNLVHDTGASTSILKKLNLKDIQYIDTNAPKNAFANWKLSGIGMSGNVIANTPYVGIVGKELIGNSDGSISIKYFPIYKQWTDIDKTVDFETWWNTEIYDNRNGVSLTRKELVLDVANNDGGAHVDKLKERYSSFKKKDIIQFNVNGKLQGFDNIPAYTAIMQISWELAESIKKVLI